MNFNPVFDELEEEFKLVKKGVYPFEVLKAENKISKNGNQMIELLIKIFLNDGSTSTFFVYLTPAYVKLIKSFCVCTGMENLFSTGNLDATDCFSKTGWADVDIQKGKENPNGGFYKDKNIVKNFVNKPEKAQNEIIDDDLPF